MNSISGPLSGGRTLLQLGVLLGVGFAGLVWVGADALGVSLSPGLKPYATVGAILLGISLIFLGHVLWHYRRSTRTDDN